MKFLEPVLKFCEARAHDIDRDSPRRPGYAPQDQLNLQKVYRACCGWKEKGWVNVKKAEVQQAWAAIWPKEPTAAELKKAEDPGNKSKIGKLE